MLSKQCWDTNGHLIKWPSEVRHYQRLDIVGHCSPYVRHCFPLASVHQPFYIHWVKNLVGYIGVNILHFYTIVTHSHFGVWIFMYAAQFFLVIRW